MPPRDLGPPPGADELPGGGRPNADPVEMLINSSRLRAELGIDKTQLSHLKTLEREFASRQKEILQKMKGSAGQVEAARGELRVHIEAGRAMIARVLTRPQLDRLQQIMMQIGGPCLAVHDENVSLALSIDPSQMRRIAAACRGMREALPPPPPSGRPEEVCAAMEQAAGVYEAKRREVDAEVTGVLSEGQRAALTAMEGRPFHMDPPTPPECERPAGPEVPSRP